MPSTHITEAPMDRYTKTLLTIITAALVWLGVKDFAIVEEAMASAGVVEVKVVDIEFKSWKPVPVEVQGEIRCRTP